MANIFKIEYFEEGDHSSDEDFSPGHLIIDTEESDNEFMGSKKEPSTPSTPGSSRLSETPRKSFSSLIESNSGDNEFKGLTFVGKMDVSQSPDSSDTLCLYNYHWGSTNIDVITRNTGETLVPMKNVYGRVVPGLTRNAVSNRIPKIGAKTVALSEPHIATLKKLQLPITARSHYLTVNDFIHLCHYYKKDLPQNLGLFSSITSQDNPAEVLKTFNALKPNISLPLLGPPNGNEETESSQKSNQSDFAALSPGRLNASLAYTVGDALQQMTSVWTQSQTKQLKGGLMSPTAGSEIHPLALSNGIHLALIIQNSCPYLLNAELSQILPQANQNVIGPLRSLLNIPLEYASRPNMNALKEEGVIGTKACRAIVYKVSDVIRMFGHWGVPVPQFLHDINNGKIPVGTVNVSPMSAPLSESSSIIINSSSLTPHTVTPTSADMMSPSGVRVDIRMVKKERKDSHSSLPPLNDQDLDYNYLPWGDEKRLTLLCPPTGEPHVAIAELVDKIFSQRSQVSLQKRTRLGISTVPATSLQIHALRARGSIDPASGYSKLIALSGVVILARECGIPVPANVMEECSKHLSVPIDSMHNSPSLKKTPTKSTSFSHTSSLSPRVGKLPNIEGIPMKLRQDVLSHPDVIIPGKGYNTAEGVLFQVLWGKSKIVIFTSVRGISYVGLYQIYDCLFKHLVTRMNFKMRMRKLGIKSIRAPPSIRLHLIKLEALPTSSPVCGLLRISEMERLVKSYEIKPPKVFYDLFINKKPDAPSSDIFKDFCTIVPQLPTHMPSQQPIGSVPRLSMAGVPQPSIDGRASYLPLGESGGVTTINYSQDSLVVSVPRALVNINHPHSHVKETNTQLPYPQSKSISSHYPHHKTSILQNLAKKISQKNHRLAATITPSTMPTRECQSCGRVYPLAKKRCEACGIYLVGRPCPECNSLNYSRCTHCVKCGRVLDVTTIKSVKEGDAVKRFEEAEALQESQYETTPTTHIYQGTHNTTTPPNPTYSEDRERTKSESSESDSQSTASAIFSAPPIRAAVLKNMFPGQQSNSGVVTKTIYSGSVGSTRKCMECGMINSKMAKKCQQCKSPVQGRPCPSCSRPNHNHSTECYKCGTTLPPTTTKWIMGNKIIRTSQDGNVVSGITSAQLNKEVIRRAPINCIRCHRMRQKGRFKCGRCGDLYTLSPLLDSSGKLTKQQDHIHTDDDTESSQLLKLAENLSLIGVGSELIPTLSDKEQSYWDQLPPAEAELSVISDEYQVFLTKKTNKEMLFSDLQSELDGLVISAEKLNNEVQQLYKMNEEAELIVKTYPEEIKKIEDRLSAINELRFM